MELCFVGAKFHFVSLIKHSPPTTSLRTRLVIIFDWQCNNYFPLFSTNNTRDTGAEEGGQWSRCWSRCNHRYSDIFLLVSRCDTCDNWAEQCWASGHWSQHHWSVVMIIVIWIQNQSEDNILHISGAAPLSFHSFYSQMHWEKYRGKHCEVVFKFFQTLWWLGSWDTAPGIVMCVWCQCMN